jgi:hypothetical protein
MTGRRLFFFAAALIGVLAVPAASSAQDGADRPFSATLTGSATWLFPGDTPSQCTIVTTLTESTGQATHLGRVAALWSHCPAEPGYVIDGRVTITAANGDTLTGQYDYDPTVKSNILAIAWTGGTGRFANASGAVAVTYNVIQQFIPGCNPVPKPSACYDFSVPWPWSATMVGTISY